MLYYTVLPAHQRKYQSVTEIAGVGVGLNVFDNKLTNGKLILCSLDQRQQSAIKTGGPALPQCRGARGGSGAKQDQGGGYITATGSHAE